MKQAERDSRRDVAVIAEPECNRLGCLVAHLITDSVHGDDDFLNLWGCGCHCVHTSSLMLNYGYLVMDEDTGAGAITHPAPLGPRDARTTSVFELRPLLFRSQRKE